MGAEAPVAPKIRYTKPDLSSATDTFAALARMCGVTERVQDASLDFQGFSLAFEQLYNDNVSLEEGQLAELRRELAVETDDDPVSLHDWGPFHASYMKRSGMASVLSMQATQKQKEKDNDDALRLLREQHAQREKDWAQQLEKAKMDQARSRRPVVWRRLHAIFMNRLQERRSRVVYFLILRGFGPI